MIALPGLVLMGLSALTFSVMAACIKVLRGDGLLLGEGLPTSEIVFLRGVICSAMTVAAMRVATKPITVNRRGLLVIRGLCGFTGLFLYTEALGRIELPDAIALQYTHPVFTALFAAWFLGEKMPRYA